MYYDANNLYSWAMSQSLPYGNFKWIKAKKFNLNKIKSKMLHFRSGFRLST